MKRIEWLDFAKGISIFMVVLGHTLRGIYTHNLYLNYDKYFSKGNKKLNLGESYTSHNTARLDVEGMKELLKKLELFGGPVRQHD